MEELPSSFPLRRENTVRVRVLYVYDSEKADAVAAGHVAAYPYPPDIC